MTQDTNAAMQRYHDVFDSAQYNAVAEFLASNLNADRDDQRVVDGMIIVQNVAFELCGHADFNGAWHALAVFCGRAYLSVHTVDAMRDFLRRFAPDDIRVDDFDATAKAMLIAFVDWMKSKQPPRTRTAFTAGAVGWLMNCLRRSSISPLPRFSRWRTAMRLTSAKS